MSLLRRVRERLYRGPTEVQITCGISRSVGMSCPECWRPVGPVRSDCSLCQTGSPFWTGDLDSSNQEAAAHYGKVLALEGGWRFKDEDVFAP